MSGRNTDVPSMVATALPVPVAAAEYEQCPATDVLHRIGDKWTVLLVVLLGNRPYRFNELHRAIEGISQRMLTRTLRVLEQDGIVRRTVFPTVPPSVEYSVTELGRSLLVPLSAVADWAVEHHAEIVAARQSMRSPAGPAHSQYPSAFGSRRQAD
jgi:DNA-binding HxlR family transcriptional regulator